MNIIWRPHTEIPQASGWYRVKRIDEPEGSLLVRAFGQGHWWTPLPDGWISSDGVYEWESLPLCSIASPDDPISPIEEMKRAAGTVDGVKP